MASKLRTVAFATVLILLVTSGLGEAGKKSKKPKPGSRKAESSEEMDFKKLGKSGSSNNSDVEELFLRDDRCTKQNSMSQKQIRKCAETMGFLLEFKENNRNCTCVGKKWKKCVSDDVPARESTTAQWNWNWTTSPSTPESTTAQAEYEDETTFGSAQFQFQYQG